jgi:hypothetical protein
MSLSFIVFLTFLLFWDNGLDYSTWYITCYEVFYPSWYSVASTGWATGVLPSISLFFSNFWYHSWPYSDMLIISTWRLKISANLWSSCPGLFFVVLCPVNSDLAFLYSQFWFLNSGWVLEALCVSYSLWHYLLSKLQ